MIDEKSVRNKLSIIHNGDAQQLKVIFSNSDRLIVEAPAGYGKTTTMVSRIAYLYCTGKIVNPKKVLGLTFSINAALKIKRDISSKLPDLIGGKNNPIDVSEKVTVTNYHGFCKQILRKYGYLENPILKKNINLFRAVGESELNKDSQIVKQLTEEDKNYLLEIEEKIKSTELPERREIEHYLSIVYYYLLPHEIITHTAEILITLQLFSKHENIRKFYNEYYSLIIVDEFQDTNCISWELLKTIIGNSTQLLFLGDSLQRIYGFIGAIPNIMNLATKEFRMEEIPLTKNYRFMNNKEMLKLDNNIRENARKKFLLSPLDTANLPAIFTSKHEDESEAISLLINRILIEDKNSKIALLFRGRGKDVEITQSYLDDAGENYFYGMFTDEDDEYIEFHRYCQEKLIREFGNRKVITTRLLNTFCNDIKTHYYDRKSESIKSLLILLNAFIKKIEIDYKDLLPEEKYEILLDAFENRQLKQAMEYVNSNIILSTVHGAKGLEWDYVIIADLERWSFPNFATCGICNNRFNNGIQKCYIPDQMSDILLNKLMEELSVFYVAITRARKQVYVTASQTRYNSYGQIKTSCFSCMATLRGIKLVDCT